MGNILDKPLVLDRIKEYYKLKGNAELARFLGVAPNTITNWYGRKTFDIDVIYTKCVGIDMNWLLTGEGNMTYEVSKEENTSVESTKKKNLIPFYDDVASIGGVNTISATMEGHMPSNEWIDAGDWFIDATAAIRHYGNSMIEYPSGCILALKELHDQRQIIWGRNYCIETDEMRVTKRLQAGTDEYLMAYSTNTETYPDGHLIHEPFRIYKDTIRRIFMVIGCVIKEYSSGPVIIKNT